MYIYIYSKNDVYNAATTAANITVPAATIWLVCVASLVLVAAD